MKKQLKNVIKTKGVKRKKSRLLFFLKFKPNLYLEIRIDLNLGLIWIDLHNRLLRLRHCPDASLSG